EIPRYEHAGKEGVKKGIPKRTSARESALPEPPDRSGVLGRVRVELLLAARGTEVVSLSLVLARELRGLLIHGHLADRVDCHTIPHSLPFFASGIYVLSRSERLTTVTELSAMARAASSGRKVIPKDG